MTQIISHVIKQILIGVAAELTKSTDQFSRQFLALIYVDFFSQVPYQIIFLVEIVLT